MLVYLDESGDTGFRFKHGSSRYFVIALLLVDDPLDIQIAVDELRRELGYDLRPEFKFKSSKPFVREQFLHAICQLDFNVRSLVVDKHQLTSPQMRDRTIFYNYLVRQILQHDGGTIDRATLVLDESVKSRTVKAAAGTYLRRMLNNGDRQKILKIQHRNSRNDNLIQAIDMISGAIYHRYERQDDRYFHLIRRRVQDIWEFQPYRK